MVFFEGGCFDIFCGGYVDITWHRLESCFTAFLRRAAFTAYFEAAFFAAFFRGSCFVAFFGGGCFAAFLGGSALRHFWRVGLERPLRSLHIKTITECMIFLVIKSALLLPSNNKMMYCIICPVIKSAFLLALNRNFDSIYNMFRLEIDNFTSSLFK